MSNETNLTERLGNYPFVTLGHKSKGWHGFEALTYRLAVPGEYPIQKNVIYWARLTLVMHLQGEPNQVEASEGRRWKRCVSQPGGIFFSEGNAHKRIMWAKPSSNLAMSLDTAFLAAIASEISRGDPARLAIGHHSYFRDALLAQMGYAVAALLADDSAGGRLYGESLAVSIAHHLLYHYAGKQTAQRAPKAMTNSALQCALDYIHAHYDENFSLAEVAAAAGLSIAHFSRLFRRATGHAPYQYLIQLRCEKACILLQSGRYTVTEAAQAVGFFDHSHLLRHFKRQYHVTPREWLATQ